MSQDKNKHGVHFLELTNILDICDRIKETLQADTWKEVAKALEMAPRHLSVLRHEAKNPGEKNRQLPLKHIVNWAIKHGVNINWLLTGEAPGQEDEQADPKTARLLSQARDVIESDGPFAEVLSKNIEVFHLSVKSGVGRKTGSVKCLECGLIIEDPLSQISKDGPWVVCPACCAKIKIKVDQVEDIKSAIRDAAEGVDGPAYRSRKTST